MALYLVGENIDKTRSHYRAEAGDLVQLMRGVYVDAADDADAVALKHSVRLAKFLYPRAYLSAASAVLLGPTRNGRLYISGRRNQRTRLRSLEIVQNEVPSHPSLAPAVIDDGMGEFRIDVSSIRQRFLEAFRLRSEHAGSIDDAMREAMGRRLAEEYGDGKGAADAVWALARENQWYREGELAERYLLHRPAAAVAVRNEAALDLTVAWHGKPIGDLVHDGFEWRWKPVDDGGPPLIRQTTPGKLPPFILSLLPEGWLESVLKDRDERALLRSGRRYTSNITIAEKRSDLAGLPADILLTRLADFSEAGVFTGRYAGPGRNPIEDSFERNLAEIFARAETPRLSGVQIKAPMYLDADGTLIPSIDKPFMRTIEASRIRGIPMLKTAFAALLLTIAPAMALDQAFLGTWALDAASCADTDSTVRFTVTPKKLQGREIACTLKRASRAGSSWRMRYSCIGEGEDYSLDLKWRLGANGHLLEQAQGKANEYMRCGSAKQAAAPPAPALAADGFAGKYLGTVDAYEWTATITPTGDQSYKVRVQVGSAHPACMGDIEASGRLKAGRIVTQRDQNDSCVLTISRNDGGITVVEKDCAQDHGAACTFTSSMKRVGQ